MRAGFGLLAGLYGSSAGNEREGWKGSLSRRLARLSAPSGYSLLQKSTRGGGALFQRRRQAVVRGGGERAPSGETNGETLSRRRGGDLKRAGGPVH